MTAELLEQARDLLAAVASESVASLSDEALCRMLHNAEQAGRLIDATRAHAAVEIDHRSRIELGRDGLAQRHGHARGSHLIERITRIPQAEAVRRIRLGEAIRPRVGLCGDALPALFPAISTALVAGTIGTDAAAAVIRCLTQAARQHATPAALEHAEQQLALVAAREPADLVAVHARAWREALDPDGAEPRDAELRARRAFHLGRERDGMTPFSGAADPASAALLRAAFAERSGPGVKPRHLDPADRESLDLGPDSCDDSPEVVTLLADPRSREQRQFDIILGLITAGVRSSEGQSGSMRATSTVMAVIQLSDLEKGTGVGWLDDADEPVSAATIQTMACDAGFARIILGSQGEVLSMGMHERFFTRTQRLALAVRDGGCIWPQCTAPPSWCHAHHVTEYSKGGRTDVSNGALLCPAHHHMLHASEFELRMIRGTPRLLAPPWLDPQRSWRPLGKARVTFTPSA